MENKKILLIVPHEDDELLLAAGLIYKRIQEGNSIQVVIVTNGDYDCADYSVGMARMRETIEGLKLLGLSEHNIWFLGYADTGMPKEDSFLYRLYLEKDGEKIYPSSCSSQTYGLPEKPDFHSLIWGQPGSYNRNTLKGDIKKIIQKIRADEIFTTCEYDTHGDHVGLVCFLKEIVSELKQDENYQPNVYSGIVHSMAGDEKWPVRLPDNHGEIEMLTCPPGWEEQTKLLWKERMSFPVPTCMMESDRSKNLKFQAISKHVTALKPDAVDYLYSFVKAEEVFFKII